MHGIMPYWKMQKERKEVKMIELLSTLITLVWVYKKPCLLRLIVALEWCLVDLVGITFIL